MKYFVRQVRAVKIDEFQFRKGSMFEVSYEKAKELYWHNGMENAIDGMVDSENVDALFERGQFVNIHKMGLLIYGEDCTDAELFKDRLNGKIAKEVWK